MALTIGAAGTSTDLQFRCVRGLLPAAISATTPCPPSARTTVAPNDTRPVWGVREFGRTTHMPHLAATKYPETTEDDAADS